MRPAVGRDNPRQIGGELPEDHEVALSLKDLQDVVVRGREHGRTFVRPDDAPLLQWPVLVAVEPGERPPRGGPFLAFGGERWNLPVRRIRDKRRPAARQLFGLLRGQPLRVVVVGRVDLLHPLLALLVARREDAARQRVNARLGHDPGELRGLRFGQKLLAGIPVGPLQGGVRLRRPEALEIRMAVRRARERPLAGPCNLRLGAQWCYRQGDRDGEQEALHR